MLHLLNLLAAIALLVWGTHNVRTGVLRAFGENLRGVLSRSVSNRVAAFAAGLGVTGMVQSSTATCLITSSFVGQRLIATSAALAIMLGADVGTSLITVVFSFDLSWLSPLLIFVGVVLFVSRQNTTAGRIGRISIGLGLIILALQLIFAATRPMTESPAVQALLAALPNEVVLDLLVGALLAVLSYSSLAIVLLTATLADSGLVPLQAALGIVLGANLGSGLLAILSTMKSSPLARRVPLGNFLFKLIGVALAAPLIPAALPWISSFEQANVHAVVAWHLVFNAGIAVLFISFTGPMAKLAEQLLPSPAEESRNGRPRHLDPIALATPSLAITCAAREALHQADVVETMLRGILPVIRNDDLRLAAELRRMDDTVDDLYSQIKYYLTKISRESLSEHEGRRWTDIISFTINMEQIGDIIERVLQDVEDKKINRGRSF
ncbi:MAG: Na/Pi cotransporter family protein, partial [Burkholderiaceae bacterium]|nr:Na/Pi cotransporter family protein [Burkholderiaceae bacterium]